MVLADLDSICSQLAQADRPCHQFHLAIAEFDLSPAEERIEEEDCGALFVLDERHFELLTNFLSDTCEDLAPDWIHRIARDFDISFSSLDRLTTWALSIEGRADCETFVSHLEFFAAFRLHCGSTATCHRRWLEISMSLEDCSRHGVQVWDSLLIRTMLICVVVGFTSFSLRFGSPGLGSLAIWS